MDMHAYIFMYFKNKTTEVTQCLHISSATLQISNLTQPNIPIPQADLSGSCPALVLSSSKQPAEGRRAAPRGCSRPYSQGRWRACEGLGVADVRQSQVTRLSCVKSCRPRSPHCDSAVAQTPATARAIPSDLCQTPDLYTRASKPRSVPSFFSALET